MKNTKKKTVTRLSRKSIHLLKRNCAIRAVHIESISLFYWKYKTRRKWHNKGLYIYICINSIVWSWKREIWMKEYCFRKHFLIINQYNSQTCIHNWINTMWFVTWIPVNSLEMVFYFLNKLYLCVLKPHTHIANFLYL